MKGRLAQTWSNDGAWRYALAPLLVLVALVLLTSTSSEPFYWNDETRHVMTGVFFMDYLGDGQWASARAYAERYYLQYPSLGLLVWPPLFHGIEGAVMLVFGPSMLVAKAVILAFALIAAAYLFALVARSHDGWTAALASLLFVVSPMILTFSRQVMLEMPALAFVLAATFHWVVYLDTRRAVHVWLAAAAAAAGVLTRFDAGAVLPVLLLILAFRGDSRALRGWHPWLAALLALAAVAPMVWLTAVEFGAVHLSTITPQDSGSGWTAIAETLGFYLRSLPEQVGWTVPVAAIVCGAWCIRTKAEWRRLAPYVATIVCTYVIFTAIAEKTPRHTIGWVPALAALAAIAIGALRQRSGATGLAWVVAFVTVAGTAVPALQARTPYVRGYARAAEYVVAHTAASKFTLFDGYYDGNFTYQVRRLDPRRRLWVLRGDKLFYASVINVGQQYTEFTRSDKEMADLLASYDPELVVVESPPVGDRWTPAARRLRQLLAGDPDRYRLEQRIPLETDTSATGTTLLIYRSLKRNPNPRTSVELEMLTMGGQKFQAPDAGQKPVP